MTDDTVTSVDMDDLDNFSNTFFGKDAPVETDEPTEDNEDEEVSENGDDTPATEEDTDAPEEEEPQDDEDQEDEEAEEAPKPKGKKSAKERIEELYADNKTKERALAQLQREVEALKNLSKTEEKTSEEPVTKTVDPKDQPKPDDVDDKGEAKYLLGEYDPLYIRDLTKFYNELDRQEAKLKDAAEKAETEKTKQEEFVKAAQEEIKASWIEKVDAVEKELPDLREKLAGMEEAFEGIDPAYGEFLAASIMSCDNGPKIMYFLSQNIGEAQKIVASGPQAAILALGRLDAKFETPKGDEKRNTKLVSKAKEPPVQANRGTGHKAVIAEDTDDLDAFSRLYFNKK